MPLPRFKEFQGIAMSDDNEITQDEMTTLKARADMMGLTYHPSIGLEKLREKVLSAVAPEVLNQAEAPSTHIETASELRFRKKREASELVRVRITCMNPDKKEWEGEIFTVGNSVVGSFTRFVPFGAEDGWHVEKIIYNQIAARQCQIFVAIRDAKGNTVRKGKLIKEFGVEVLPNLDAEELEELARRQAMAHTID